MDRDPSLVSVLDLPSEWEAERTDPTATWVRLEIADELARCCKHFSPGAKRAGQEVWRSRRTVGPNGEHVKAHVRAAPPYAVVLLSAPGLGRPPGAMDGTVIAATEDGVAIGCQSDGDTEFVLGDLSSVGQDGIPAFQGRLRANGGIALQTVEGATLLEHAVPTAWADVWVWLNHPTEPDLVVVGVVGVKGFGLTTSIVAFRLPVEDDWPPVAVESLPGESVGEDVRILSAPLFVRGLSAGDLIHVETTDGGEVVDWRLVEASRRTTVWLLRLAGDPDIDATLRALRELGCNTVGAPHFGSYAVDVPGGLPIGTVDAVLDRLDVTQVAVAFPSMRHDE